MRSYKLKQFILSLVTLFSCCASRALLLREEVLPELPIILANQLEANYRTASGYINKENGDAWRTVHFVSKQYVLALIELEKDIDNVIYNDTYNDPVCRRVESRFVLEKVGHHKLVLYKLTEPIDNAKSFMLPDSDEVLNNSLNNYFYVFTRGRSIPSSMEKDYRLKAAYASEGRVESQQNQKILCIPFDEQSIPKGEQCRPYGFLIEAEDLGSAVTMIEKEGVVLVGLGVPLRSGSISRFLCLSQGIILRIKGIMENSLCTDLYSLEELEEMEAFFDVKFPFPKTTSSVSGEKTQVSTVPSLAVSRALRKPIHSGESQLSGQVLRHQLNISQESSVLDSSPGFQNSNLSGAVEQNVYTSNSVNSRYQDWMTMTYVEVLAELGFEEESSDYSMHETQEGRVIGYSHGVTRREFRDGSVEITYPIGMRLAKSKEERYYTIGKCNCTMEGRGLLVHKYCYGTVEVIDPEAKSMWIITPKYKYRIDACMFDDIQHFTSIQAQFNNDSKKIVSKNITFQECFIGANRKKKSVAGGIEVLDTHKCYRMHRVPYYDLLRKLGFEKDCSAQPIREKSVVRYSHGVTRREFGDGGVEITYPIGMKLTRSKEESYYTISKCGSTFEEGIPLAHKYSNGVIEVLVPSHRNLWIIYPNHRYSIRNSATDVSGTLFLNARQYRNSETRDISIKFYDEKSVEKGLGIVEVDNKESYSPSRIIRRDKGNIAKLLFLPKAPTSFIQGIQRFSHLSPNKKPRDVGGVLVLDGDAEIYDSFSLPEPPSDLLGVPISPRSYPNTSLQNQRISFIQQRTPANRVTSYSTPSKQPEPLPSFAEFTSFGGGNSFGDFSLSKRKAGKLLSKDRKRRRQKEGPEEESSNEEWENGSEDERAVDESSNSVQMGEGTYTSTTSSSGVLY